MMEKENKNLSAKVLIVDDDVSILKELSVFIERCGFAPLIARDGNSMFVSIEAEKPEVILLDISLPDEQGFELCKRLKISDQTRDIPVIFISADSTIDAKIEAFESGGTDYLSKPYALEEIKVRINNHLLNVRQRREIQRKNDELTLLVSTLRHDLANVFNSLSLNHELVVRHPTKLTDRWIKQNQVQINVGTTLIKTITRLQQTEKESIILSEVNVYESLQKAQIILNDKFIQKNITFRNCVNSNIVVIVEESTLISSVINNILTNAIKYSDKDTTVTVSARVLDGEVELLFRDQGDGIKEKEIKNIESWKDMNSSLGTHGEKGTGFGLWVMSKFVGLYGGSTKIIGRRKEEYPVDHGTDVIICIKGHEAK